MNDFENVGAGEAQSARSRLMGRIRSKNTTPELVVRRAIHARGRRFRLHREDLPGKPDIVMPARRLAIFVHGCFWHQHHGCKLASRPKTRVEYWEPKLARNVARDKLAVERLQALNWTVAIIWECQTRDALSLSALLDELLRED